MLLTLLPHILLSIPGAAELFKVVVVAVILLIILVIIGLPQVAVPAPFKQIASGLWRAS